mmetsp:Transcript_24068/g.29907  ORF Transcript_24068/g.29907 Transcript_24068/m.29907 type:complete len:113 (+) Transcript_24068:2-340(+)
MINRLRLPAIMPARKILSVDIGGTLAKTAFYVSRDDPIRQDAHRFEALTSDSIPKLANGDKIFLKSFKSHQIDQFVQFVKDNNLVDTAIHATGGGAHKYADLFEAEFGSQGV